MRKILKITSEKKSITEGFEDFIIHCKSKNLSEATIKSYRDTIEYTFSKFMSLDSLTEDINSTTIQKFIAYLKGTCVKDTTINSYLRMLRAVLYYFMKLGWMPEFKIQLIKADKEVIETYADSEINLLLKKPNIKKCPFVEYRNWMVCNFLLATGCRSKTLLNIKVKDIDFENSVVIYRHTKGRTQQIVPLSSTISVYLREYISYINKDGYLFPNAYGEIMNNSTLGHNMNDYNRKRGVGKTGLHRWRHTFAKKYILNGGDIFRLQKILGHSDMTIVRNYVNMFSNDLKDNFDSVNPLENAINKKSRIRIKK